MTEVKARKTKECEAELTATLAKVDADTRRTINRGKHCGQWLGVIPSTVNGTELSAQEFRDNLCMRCARFPGDLPKHCDGCISKHREHNPFTMRHALQCKTGGLITVRHDEIAGELMDWAAKALTNSAVKPETLHPTGSHCGEKLSQTAPAQKANQQSTNHATRLAAHQRRRKRRHRHSWSLPTRFGKHCGRESH